MTDLRQLLEREPSPSHPSGRALERHAFDPPPGGSRRWVPLTTHGSRNSMRQRRAVASTGARNSRTVSRL